MSAGSVSPAVAAGPAGSDGTGSDVAGPVLSIGDWRNNAEMIADVARLGYIADDTLDLSYGLGKFWTIHRPAELVTNDIDPAKGEHSYDVREAPPAFWCLQFRTVVWDGPYRMSGRRDGRTAKKETDFDDRFGTASYETDTEILGLLEAGIDFGFRCVRRGGFLLVKCQAQVCGGRKVWQPRHLAAFAEGYPMRQCDEFHLRQNHARAQPPGRPQRHSRSNFSTLLVFEVT